MSESETKEDYSTNFEDDDVESPFEDNETSLEESEQQNLGSQQTESGTNGTGEGHTLDTSADVDNEIEESDDEESDVDSIFVGNGLGLELPQGSKVQPSHNAEEPSVPISESQSSKVALGSGAGEQSHEHKQDFNYQAEPSSSSPFKENSEIEEIMKKIEKLERAQNMLENFMNDEGEGKDDNASASVVNSSRSVGSNNVSSYSQPFTPCKSPSNSSSRLSGNESKGKSSPKGIKSSQDKENVSDPTERSRSTSLKSNSEIEDIMKQIEKLEMSQNSLENFLVGVGDVKDKTSSVSSAVVKSSRSVGSNDISSRSKPTTPRKSQSSGHQPGPSHPTVVKVLSAYSEVKPPVIPVKASSRPVSSDRPDKSPRKVTSGRGASGDGFTKAAAAFNEHQKNSKEIEKLKRENLKQEALLEAYQKENETLFIELRQVKERLKEKDEEHLEEVNRLKTEIATLKLNRLVPASPRFGQKAEVDRLNDELKGKAEQIIELHREVARLKMEIARSKTAVNNKPEKKEAKPSKAALMSQEKENDYQKNIRSLQKQVRTLQKILYHKDPSTGPPPGITGSKDEIDKAIQDPEAQLHVQQTTVLEARIVQLESDLTKVDLDSKEKMKEFQIRFTGLKTKYEERIRDLELKLREAEDSIKPPELSILEDMTLKLEKAQNEITHLKLEISRHKRELEIAAKSNVTSSSSQLTARQDAGTLSLAIKTFKGELAEKEKELLRTKKEILELKKTNLNLKREREKYLASSTVNTQFANRLPVRSKSEIHPHPGRGSCSSEAKGPGSVQGRPSTTGTSTMLNRGNAAYQLLQSTLETERSEFEEILAERNKVIRAKEKEITDLNAKLESMTVEGPSGTKNENPALIDELRSRLSLSNRVTNLIKDQLNRVNTERLALQKEKGVMEFRIRELTQQLNLANTLGKPENEILLGLTEKVENLNSRYYYREKQLDALLNRLAMKTSASVYPSSLTALGLFHDGHPDPFTMSSSHSIKNSRLTELDLASLSPTTMRLLGDGSDSS